MQIPGEQHRATEEEEGSDVPKRILRRPQPESRVGNDTRSGSHRSAHGGGRQRRGLKEFATHPAAAASPPASSSDFTPVKVLVGNAQKRREKEASSPAVRILARPRPVETRLPEADDEATTRFLTRDIKFMTASARLIDDNLGFMDFCREYLLDWSDKFHVVGIVGPQGVGKSTLLSMLAGNEPTDAYRQYVFRPGSREAVELGRYQTTKINVFVDRWRSIHLDCQSSSPSLFEDYVRLRKRDANFSPVGYDVECLQLTMLMLHACDTVIICVDAFEEVYNCAKELVEAERHSPPSPAALSASTPSSKPEQPPTGKINVVVVQQRAVAEDFHPLMVRERMRKLESLFEGVERFEICAGVNMASLGQGRYAQLSSSRANYVVLGDMRCESYKSGRGRQELQSVDDAPSLTLVTKGRLLLPRVPSYTGWGSYAELVDALKIEIPRLPRRRSTPGTSELEWFNATRRAWNRIINIDTSTLRGGNLRTTTQATTQPAIGRRRGGERAGRRERRQREPAAADKRPTAGRGPAHDRSWRGDNERPMVRKVIADTENPERLTSGKEGRSAVSATSRSTSSSSSPGRSWRNRRRKQGAEDECDDSDCDADEGPAEKVHDSDSEQHSDDAAAAASR